MLSKKLIRHGVAVVALLTVLFTGCKSTSSAIKLEAGNELSAWKGEWQSLSAISGATQLNDAYRMQAEKMPYYTEDGLKAAVSAMLATPIVKVKFNGSNTVVFTVIDTEGKEKQIPCEYRYTGTKPMQEAADRSWYAFEAIKPVQGLAEAQYFIIVSPHRDSQDSLLHWHARFGSRDIKSLVESDPLWWPTYTGTSVSNERLVKAMTGMIKEVAETLPKSSLMPYTGKWMNTALIYDDPRPAVQEAYAKLIKEFSGKKDGSDFTKEEIIVMAKKSYGTASDFTHLEFITENDKNEMVVWKGNTELSRVAYSRDGANKLRATAKAFIASDRQKAGKFAFLSMTTPHGVPAHMHLWYGMKPSEIEKTDGAKPTCIPANSSEELVANRVLSTCRNLLKEATK